VQVSYTEFQSNQAMNAESRDMILFKPLSKL
jgi:hypothetical protein